MLPNINLQSGEPVAVELTYTPGAAEVVNPLEGNLALAVQAVPFLGNGHFLEPLIELSFEEHVALLNGDESDHYGKWYTTPVGAHSAWTIENGGAYAVPIPGESSSMFQVLVGIHSIESVYFHVDGNNVGGSITIVCLPYGDPESPLVSLSPTLVGGDNSVQVGFESEQNFVTLVILQCYSDPGTDFVVSDMSMSGVESITITALQTQASGTRIPTAPGILYSGAAPADMILIPLDPAIYGLGAAPQRVGLVEFETQGGIGLSAIRAAIVRWRDPS